MKKTPDLEDLNIGNIIKEIVHQRGVSPKKIAALIRRYEKNTNKIYQLDDMPVDDIVHISYLSEYNILEVISCKYLSHLPFNKTKSNQRISQMSLNTQTGKITTSDNIGNCDFLEKIHIGQYIRKVAEKNGWDEQYMAEQLQCSQSNISYLYQQKSLKVKTLIEFSKVLGRNLIAEVYLSQMFTTVFPDIFSYSSITTDLY